jgi:hypothetical protein
MYVLVGDDLERVVLTKASDQLDDYLYANGDFKLSDSTGEFLSYITGKRERQKLEEWLAPPDRPIRSATAGLERLVSRGHSFTNAPDLAGDYVERSALQRQITQALTDPRRFMLTFRGTGGIGKTSLALRMIQEASSLAWFDVILWFSARDIDLRATGASFVSPEVVTLSDIAGLANSLLSELGFASDGHKVGWLGDVLGSGDLGSTLWVLDNFETVHEPLEVYSFFDRYVQPPHKVLITTRHREFVGDYPIEIGGLDREEFDNLVDREQVRLGLEVSTEIRDQLFEDGAGHPYVTKVLLAEMRRSGRGRPRRVLERREDLLDALFERTFGELSQQARHIFLLLCSWHSVVPVAALEAALLVHDSSVSPDVIDEAINELEAFSLISIEQASNELWIDMPLPAWIFGHKKLSSDPGKIDLEKESRILQLFDPTTTGEVKRGLERQALRFWDGVKERVGSAEWPRWRRSVEMLARKEPQLWLRLGDAQAEYRMNDEAETSFRKFIESFPDDPAGWLRLAQHYESAGKDRHALQAWVARALLKSASFADVSFAANKMNGWHSRGRVRLDPEARRTLIEP